MSRKRTAKQRARYSRNKGKAGEREACVMLEPVFPDVRRRAMQARGGREGADLEFTGEYHFEVGVGSVNPRTKWEQAATDAQAVVSGGFRPDTPIALTRRTGGPKANRKWLVTMDLDDWMERELDVRSLKAALAERTREPFEPPVHVDVGIAKPSSNGHHAANTETLAAIAQTDGGKAD